MKCNITGDRCIVCGNSKTKDPNISLHRFPAGEVKKRRWIEIMELIKGTVKPHSRICSRHFRNGDLSSGPERTLGKKFASPKKLYSKRSKRAQQRDIVLSLTGHLGNSPVPRSSKSPTPIMSPPSVSSSSTLSDYVALSENDSDIGSVHKSSGSNISIVQSSTSLSSGTNASSSSLQSIRSDDARLQGYENSEVVVNTALLMRIERKFKVKEISE